MPLYDFRCEACGHTEQVICKVSEMISADDLPTWCPKCELLFWDRVILTAPATKVKGTHAQETGRMQQSLRERFIRSGEIEDVRHKHGSVFDESLVGAALDRIKRGDA